jgi:hypothetical protein
MCYEATYEVHTNLSKCYESVTYVLRRCYVCATKVLRMCYKGVTKVLRRCYASDIVALQDSGANNDVLVLTFRWDGFR